MNFTQILDECSCLLLFWIYFFGPQYHNINFFLKRVHSKGCDTYHIRITTYILLFCLNHTLLNLKMRLIIIYLLRNGCLNPSITSSLFFGLNNNNLIVISIKSFGALGSNFLISDLFSGDHSSIFLLTPVHTSFISEIHLYLFEL